MKKDLEREFISDVLGAQLFSDHHFPRTPEVLDWLRLEALLIDNRLTTYFSVLGIEHAKGWDKTFLDKLKHDRYSAVNDN